MIITAPKDISCSIDLPASKSISNRVLVISALASPNGTDNFNEIVNLATCDDSRVVKEAFANGLPYEINIGAAGTAMRFMTAYLAQREGEEHVITGTKRMQERPISVLVDALRIIGADIEYIGKEGFPPLKIAGKRLCGGELEIPGNISSQYVSALLMIAPMLESGLKLKLSGNISSRPYIDLTIAIMQDFGAKADWTGGDTIQIHPGGYQQRAYMVENDWSAASYWYEMFAINEFCGQQQTANSPQITLNGLMDSSRQGDSSIKYLFSLLGVKSAFSSKDGIADVTLKASRHKVERLEYDFTNIPDMAQTFVVTCCALGITFHFTGLSTLKIKETDRIEALKRELRKVGYVLEDRNDCELFWNGDTCTPTFEPINTYQDHRMAMAFAPLALKFGKIEINNPEVVSKSYPGFWEDLKVARMVLSF